MAKLFTKSGNSDQTPHSLASDLDLPVNQLRFGGGGGGWSPDYNRLRLETIVLKVILKN